MRTNSSLVSAILPFLFLGFNHCSSHSVHNADTLTLGNTLNDSITSRTNNSNNPENPSYCTISTWNIANFGASKDDDEIAFIAKTIKNFDIIAIQEVSVGPAGAQAVTRLANELNRTGSKWDYTVSNPTTGKGSERYAFLWKTSAVKISGKPWLEQSLEKTIDREPFLARFICNSIDTFLIATIHAVPKNKHPENECVQLYILDSLYEKDHLLILGDFNLSQSNAAFAQLKTKNIKPSLMNQKTSLKMKPDANGGVLANEYDNIFYEADEIILNKAEVINFTVSFPDLKSARKISDHIPVTGFYTVIR